MATAMTNGHPNLARWQRIAKQLGREFWLPFIVAMSWAWYKSASISDFIANFAASFFLTSWGIGQLVRINRQQSVEESFQVVVQHLAEVKTAVGSILAIVSSDALQEQTKGNPALKDAVEGLVSATQAASTQIAAANNAILEIGSNISNVAPPTEWWIEKSRLGPGKEPHPAMKHPMYK